MIMQWIARNTIRNPIKQSRTIKLFNIGCRYAL